MWRASNPGKETSPGSAGSKMRGGYSAPSSPFKNKGPVTPVPGRGDIKLYAADNYKYPFDKDASGL